MPDEEHPDATDILLPIDQAGAESEADVHLQLGAARASLSGTDWTIETIVQQMRKGRLDLNPRFQRRAAWTDATKSRFIESAILGYPIPQVVLAERLDRQGHFFVIDGKQRLLAIRQFYAGQGEATDRAFESLRLSGLPILQDLKGSGIQELEQQNPALFDAFESYTLRTVVIRNWGSDDFLFTLFLRLNTGSVPLSPQELRQALVPGPFVDFADDASGESLGLRRLLGNKGPDRRMVDAELVVRFMGFYLSPLQYRGNLKAFLDGTCSRLNVAWATEHDRVEHALGQMEEGIALAISVFGEEHACHKYSGEKWERSFNRAVFDVVVGAFANSEVRAQVEPIKDQIVERFKRLCAEDNSFSQALSTTTKSLEATRERFTKWFSAIRDATAVDLALPDCLAVR